MKLFAGSSPSDNDLLRRAFESFGGLDPLTRKDDFTQNLAVARNRNARLLAELNGDAKIHFPPGNILHGIIDQQSLNALATVFQDHEMVGIFAKLYLLVREAARAFVCSSEPLARWLDKTPQEVSDDELAAHFDALVHKNSAVCKFTSTDRERVVLYEFVAALCESFIFLHEVGHIVQGHLESNMRGSRMTECHFLEHSMHDQTEDGGSQTNQLKHCLELDADDYATRKVFGLMLFQPTIFWTLPKSDQIPRDTCLYAYGVSQSLVFLALDLVTRKGVLSSSMTHPVPALRTAHVYSIAYLTAKSFSEELAKKYWAYFTLAYQHTTLFWARTDLPARSHENLNFEAMLPLSEELRKEVWKVKQDSLFDAIDARNRRLGSSERIDRSS